MVYFMSYLTCKVIPLDTVFRLSLISKNIFVKEVVIMHWACTKITASLSIPDAALLDILLDKVFTNFLF